MLIALVYRLGVADTDQQEWAATVLLDGLVVSTFLPLAALIQRDSRARRRDRGRDGRLPPLQANRAEQDHRRQAACRLDADDGDRALLGLVAGAIALYDEPKAGILLGFGVGIALGGLVYSALFVLLSVITSRALIAGLIYVFIWEGLVNGFFAGTRLLSVRHYTLGVADAFVDLPEYDFDAALDPATALVLMLVFGTAATWYAVRRLRSPGEIGETT